MPKKLNHLANCPSPYLQQHADNPVDWYPWGDEALSKAKAEAKPILLSIGYSACHWCHVMAHESFEDKTTAELMNKYFVNIKVDREERPDLDKIYQTAHQLLNRRGGGWPLTVFLTPEDQTPFFSGTYFPKEPRYGMPSFKELLEKIHQVFRENQSEIASQNSQLHSVLQKLANPQVRPDISLNKEPLELALDHLEEEFDAKHGGFGDAPKFPLPTNLQRLLRRHHDHPRDAAAINMLQLSLDKMSQGGIYDQLGGGFFRYSVDAKWMIPHFEKMLYDNGPLLALYAQAYVLLKQEHYKVIAEETGHWVIDMMQSPKGGYYATLDADSLGVEGKYYYWDLEEIEDLLKGDELTLFSKVYGLDQPANFEGHYHLHQFDPVSRLTDNEKQLLTKAKNKLLHYQQQRIRPGRDEKILTSWNGLMIRGMCIAGLLLANDKFIDSAEKAYQFIKSQCWHGQQLFACYKDGKAYQYAYLDDVAFLLDGILYLLQVRWHSPDWKFALQLADILLEKFQDKNNGGFYFTSDDHEPLIQRPKPFMDEALPAGNGVAALALNRLGHLTGENKYIIAGEKTLKAASEAMHQIPSAHHSLIHALEEFLEPPEMIILRGDKEEIKTWQQRLLTEHYNPHRIILCLADDEKDLPENLQHYKAKANKTLAYVCRGTQCLDPVDNWVRLLENIK